MNYPTPTFQAAPSFSLATEQSRQGLRAAIMSVAIGTVLCASPAERHLLDQFSQGRLTLDEVVYYLEAAAKSTDQNTLSVG